MYVDSVRASQAHRGRDPGDWSWGGTNGDRWGWDQGGIHIGGITIPNAVLAALQILSARNPRIYAHLRTEIESRTANVLMI